jgi:hypothetical protein
MESKKEEKEPKENAPPKETPSESEAKPPKQIT